MTSTFYVYLFIYLFSQINLLRKEDAQASILGANIDREENSVGRVSISRMHILT